MGDLFRYVADSALPAHRHADLPCPICDRCGDVFRIYTDVDFPDVGIEPITEACAACIRKFDPEQVSEWDVEKKLPAYLRSTSDPDKDTAINRLSEIRAELRRTPRLPNFVQHDDWPFCCGDLVEYTGRPASEDAEILDREGQYWDRGPTTFHDRAASLVPKGGLAVIGGVSAFRCSGCGQRYWTFKST